MSNHNAEFALILNHTVRIGRRSGYTLTAMNQRKPSGETDIATAASVFFYMNKGDYRMLEPGHFVMGDYTMMAKESEDVQPGDIVYPVAGIVGMTYGEVLNVLAIPDFDGLTHHIEA